MKTRTFSRIALIAVALLGTTGTAFADVPSLDGAGSISGTVTAQDGAPRDSARVVLYSGQDQMSWANTDAAGNYVFRGLSAGSYAICVHGDFGTGGDSSTGYVSRCYDDAAWTPRLRDRDSEFEEDEFQDGPPSPDATQIDVQTDQQVTGIDFSLPAAAAISGYVRLKNGKPATGPIVYAYNRSTGRVYYTWTDQQSHYTMTGLQSSPKGYAVCVAQYFGHGGQPGWLPRCYRNVPWKGSYDVPSALPSSATTVRVRLGQNHTDVNITVATAGVISGTVTDAKSGKRVARMSVKAFAADGSPLSGAETNDNGHFVLTGLASARSDRVCAIPTDYTSSGSYGGQCWKNVAYHGTKSARKATPIKVTAGKTRYGIHLTVRH